MIKKLKKKFIILATISIFVLMALLVVIMNVINYKSVINEVDSILDMLAQPNAPFINPEEFSKKKPEEISDFLPPGMSPEVPYESRYFIAIVSSDGTIKETNILRINSIDQESVKDYVEKAIGKDSNRGFVDQYRYTKATDDRITRIIFLDCGRKLDSFNRFMMISIIVGLSGCMLVFVIFVFVSGKIVYPIAESYEKQKRFITDAGHEIKTPLTVIVANLDLLEADIGQNECLSDIRTQTKRLSCLTNDLVYLSKMQEDDQKLNAVDFPVSDLISEVAQEFKALAQTKNKNYQINIEHGISLFGSPDAIRQLTTILLDNAMKYSPENGIITISAITHKKNFVISVFNTTKSMVEKENIDHIFERFYRSESSRNSSLGGHGIGLSIAQAIVSAHKGSIEAETSGDYDFKIIVTIPIK